MKSKIKLNPVFFIAFCFFSYQKIFSQCSVPTVKSPIYYCLNSPSSALTATQISGAILNWYTTVTGTVPLASAPTPSTALVGSQTYYVSQTVGSCESARVAIVVNVIADTGAIATYFACDPSRATTSNSVFFDWNHVPGRSASDYGYSYSIAGGPLVFGRTAISSLEVFGVLPGQSVEFTILDVPGVPCYPTQSLTCSLACTTTTVPDFPSLPASLSICSGSTPPILPTTSTNGITGSWSVPTISNTTSGTYTFTPNGGQCATTTMLTVTVITLPTAISSPNNLTICSGETTDINLSSTQLGTTYDWTVLLTDVAGASSRSGNVIKQILITTGNIQGTVVYNITPKANGCAGIPIKATVTVNPLANPIITDGVICVDRSTNTVFKPFILDTGLGNTNYGFNWFLNSMLINGATSSNYEATEQGFYSVITINKFTGCISRDVSATVIVNYPAESVSILHDFQNNIITIITEGGTGPFRYQIDNGALQESNVFTGVSNGLHKITIKDINGCTDLSYPVQITLNNNSFAFKDLQLTPNPIVNVLTIKSNEIFTKISIYNILGQEVHSQKGSGLEVKLDVSHLVSGNYFVKVASDTKQQVFKVVKK